MSEKIWGGRFSEDTNKDVERFTSSLHDDIHLFKADILATKAHLHQLRERNIVTHEECNQIENILEQLLIERDNGVFIPDEKLEDIHMNIEKYLIDKLGDIGKKIHTGRSRNDQVVTAFKLTILERVDIILVLIKELLITVIAKAEESKDIIMPGYTHLQKAQPIRASLYFLAYFEMFYRDLEKLKFFKKYLMEVPLGAGALAGTPYGLDRFKITEELNMRQPTANSLDSVADRDYVLDVLYCLNSIMLHFSRMSEDMIIWTSEEFGFVKLSDAYTTGSSIMPQKKNPDVYELTRGKTGRVVGALVGMITTLKALPMGYNRDLQEDKHLFFDAAETVEQVLRVNIGCLNTLELNKELLETESNKGYLLATDIADYLVLKGMPFREAHSVVGKIVRFCEDNKKDLISLSYDDFKQFSELFCDDIPQYLNVIHSVDSRDSYGGTSRKSIETQIENARLRMVESRVSN